MPATMELKLFTAGRILWAVLGAAQIASAAAAETYQTLPGDSHIAYRLSHPLHSVRGVSRKFECTVDIRPDTSASRVRVSAEVRTFDSGNSNRDSKAMEAVRALRHPRVEFRSDSTSREQGAWRVFGALSFAGVTRSIDFSMRARFEGGRAVMTGGFFILLSDFGVRRPSLLLIPVSDRLDIEFELVAPLD